jgi:hypothetical protein
MTPYRKSRMRRLVPASILVLALLSGLPTDARATFIGPYDLSNWTTTGFGIPAGGGGSVDTSGAPNSITLLGGNSGCSSQATATCALAFTIHAPETGRVAFHWEYVTTDVDGPSFDKFSFTTTGGVSLTQLSNDSGPNSQSGDAIFPVVADRALGFFILCNDCVLGPANVTISEFSGPALSTVPEPGTLLLLGSSLARLGYSARRKQRRQN